MRLSLLPTLCLAGAMALLTNVSVAQRPTPPQTHSSSETVNQRAAWFSRGRRSPDNQPAAAHLFNARRQAQSLSVARPRPLRSAAAAASPSSTWTALGPQPVVIPSSGSGLSGAVSGRITTLAIDLQGDPTGNTLYVGTANGGIWKSTNALGAQPTFTPLSDAAPSMAIGSIAIDSSTQPATIYAGTGEENALSDAYSGVGILRSTDGGQTWQTVSYADNGKETFFGLAVNRIVIDPANPQHLLAATSTATLNVGGPYANTGIYQSADGGQTWTLAAQFRDPNGTPSSVTDLVYDSTNKLFYAAVSGMGLYSSPDGSAWTLLASPILGMPILPPFGGQGTPPAGAGAPVVTSSDFYRASLAVRNGTVYVLYCNSSGDLPQYSYPDTGLLQSTDEGKTWTEIATPASDIFSLPGGGFPPLGGYAQYIAAPPNSSELIVGGSDVWVAASVQGDSTSWTDLTMGSMGGSLPLNQHAIAFANPSTAFIGNDQGLWSTTDLGTTWADDNQTLGTILANTVAPVSGTPGFFTVGSSANGYSTTSAAGSSVWNQAIAGPGQFVVTDPNDPSVVYATSPINAIRRSDDGGKTFPSTVADYQVISDVDFMPTPIQVIPSRPWMLAFASTSVWVGPGLTASDGAGWKKISPIFTTGGSPAPSPYLFTPTPGISSLAVAPSSANVMYAATTLGKIYGTTNAMAASPVWNDLTAAPLPTDGSRVFSSLAVAPSDPKTVYLGVMGFGTGHVFKSTDGGASWTDISGNLPDAPVNSILIDPLNPNDIYVAGDVGVFVASDGGATGENWQLMGSGLPSAPVMQINIADVGNRMLVAATHGRGVWAIAPLSNNPDFTLQASPDIASVLPGQSATFTATVNAVNGYSGTVTLSCTAPATGCSVSPASVQPGMPATVTVAATAFSNSSGTVTLSATDGTLTHTSNVRVEAAQLVASPNQIAIDAGNTPIPVGVYTSQSAAVTGLSCSNLPTGLTCTFASTDLNPGDPPDSLTIAADPTTLPGTYPIQVTGTMNGQTVSTSVSVAVHTFDLLIPMGPVAATDTTTPVAFSIMATSTSGSTAPITLSCDPASGVTCSFSPASIIPGQVSTLTVSNFQSALKSAPASGLSINVIGTAGSDQQTTQAILQPPPPAGVDVAPVFPVDIVGVGSNFANFTFMPPVGTMPTSIDSYACTGTGQVQCAFTPDGLGIGEDLLVSGLSSLPAGSQAYSFSVLVTSQNGTQTTQQTFQLTVRFGDFTLSSPAPGQSNMTGTDTASFTVTTAAEQGFNSPINLTCTAPSGAHCAVSPATVNPGQSASVQLNGLAALTAQNLAIPVSAASGPITHSTTLTDRISDFALSAPATTATVAPGSDTATFTIHDSGINDNGASAALACKSSAALTCSFSPANLVGGASSTLTVSGINAVRSSGDTLALNVTGTSGSDAHSLPLTLKLQDFAAVPPTGSATSETIMAGQTAKFSLTYSSVNGYSGPVTLACGGGPVPSTCAVSPASFNLAAGGSQAVIVSVTTSGTSLLAPPPSGNSAPGPWGQRLVLLALLGTLGLALTRRRRLLLAAAVLLLGALLFTACGGGGSSNAVPRTPAGTTYVTITATSNGITQTTKLGLTVQ